MAVFKQGPRPEDHYTMVSNELARDPNIALRTKGVYLFMRSHRDGWHMTVERIAKAIGVAKDTVAKSIKELEDAGYIVRDQAQGKDGRFSSIEYMILSAPHPKKPDTVLPDTGKPATDSPDTENWGTKEDYSSKKTNREEDQLQEPPVVPQGGTKPASKRGERLPEGWMPTDRSIQLVKDEHPGITAEYLDREHRKFQDYWAGVAGAKGRKLDWDATWRNWIRRAAESMPRGTTSTAPAVSAPDRKIQGYHESAQRVKAMRDRRASG